MTYEQLVAENNEANARLKTLTPAKVRALVRCVLSDAFQQQASADTLARALADYCRVAHHSRESELLGYIRQASSELCQAGKIACVGGSNDFSTHRFKLLVV